MNELLIHKAINFAALKHDGQKRKGTTLPYIVHPMEVYGVLVASGCDDDVIIAGILHDVVEDTDTEIDEIIAVFGKAVADIVVSESEDKSKTWQERKQDTIERIKTASMPAKKVCCADKLSNIMSMYTDLQEVQGKLWERFNVGKDKIAWYYNGVIEALSDLIDFVPYELLKKYYYKVFEQC